MEKRKRIRIKKTSSKVEENNTTKIINVRIDGLIEEEIVQEFVSINDTHEDICKFLTETHGKQWLAYE